MEELFRYSMKPQESFFKTNDDFNSRFTVARNHAREFQAKQAKYSPLMRYVAKR